MSRGEFKRATLDFGGVLRSDGHIYVPVVRNLIKLILYKDCNSRYSIHLGTIKMYGYLRQYYWWRGMQKDIAGFMARCLSYK